MPRHLYFFPSLETAERLNTALSEFFTSMRPLRLVRAFFKIEGARHDNAIIELMEAMVGGDWVLDHAAALIAESSGLSFQPSAARLCTSSDFMTLRVAVIGNVFTCTRRSGQ